MMLANILAGFFLVGMMWDSVFHETLLLWLFVLIIAASLTQILYFYLKPAYKNLQNIPEKLFYYQLPFIFGCIWGAAGYFFLNYNSVTDAAFLIIFLSGMASGGINVLSSLWLSYATLVVPMLLPFSIKLMMEANAQTILLGSATLSYLIIMLIISKFTHDSMNKSLETRYENTSLIKELKKQTKQANQASKDKSRFLASASHDLRQPIHSLSLLTSAISPEVPSERGKKILHQMGKANDVMLDLLNSLLDISKLDAGIIKPNFIITDIDGTIEELINEFQAMAKENSIELRARTCSYMVKTDPILLSTVLRNLLLNALLYTAKGKVLVSCRKKHNMIMLQVWDTGKGIKKEHQETVFAEFQQLDNPERNKNKGLGLGLAICQRLSKLLNIRLSLNSVEGKGSVFTLDIPVLTEVEAKEYLYKKPAPAYISTMPNFKELSILVIDDNNDVLDAMKALLESWGCIVLTAASIKETMVLAKSYTYKVDIIIADYRLREETTGVEAINVFTKHVGYSLPSMLITGDTAPDRMREITSHGLPVLHKPIKEPQLKVVIGRLLRMSA